jgi:hypothetical protein
VFLWKNMADAVGAILCRPACRDSVMKNGVVGCSQIFCFHADCAELAEAHLLRVLTMREVCVLKRAERFCEFCEVRVKLNYEITMLD